MAKLWEEIKDNTAKLWEEIKDNTTFSEIVQACLLADRVRVDAYKAAIDRHVKKGSIVVDLGTGSGIFAKLAADAGAKKVYAIEIDPKMIKVAKKNLLKLKNVKVIRTNIYDFKPKEKADVVMGELTNTGCILEEQVPAFNHAIKYILKKGGTLIPYSIKSSIELVNFEFDTYGVRLDWPLMYWKDEMPPLKYFSKPVVYDNLIFDKINPLNNSKNLKVKILKTGKVNAVLIRSFVETTKGVILKPRESISSRMLVPIQKEVKVTKGKEKVVNIQWRYNSDWRKFRVTIQKNKKYARTGI